MRKIFLLLTLPLFLFGSCKKTKVTEATHQEKVNLALEKVRRSLSDTLGFEFPAISLLIQTPTEKIFATSAAPGQTSFTSGTYFRMASNTKTFTGTAILNMHEDGWLDFRAKITDTIPGTSETYLPITPDWDFPYKNEITIRQLLQHSAGVFDVDNDVTPGCGGKTFTDYMLMLDSNHQFHTQEMVALLQAHNLFYFSPGGDYHYSNTGYSMLAQIIGRVYTAKAGSFKSCTDYLQDYIIGPGAPVPLSTLHFPYLAADQNLPAPHATGSIYEATGIQVFDKMNMSAQPGEGNGYGTLEDLNTFIRSLVKGENVLTPATISLMQHEVSAANPNYGLGLSHVPNLGYGHNGARIGYLSMMYYDPGQDISVAAFLPMWDFRNGIPSFDHCKTAMYHAGYDARAALGYPGRP